jgi:hypothetical protein
MRLLGTCLIVCSALLAALGVAALVILVLGVNEDALAAAPAFMVAQPWATWLGPALDVAGDSVSLRTVMVAGLLAINPALLFVIGHLLRRSG